MKPLALLAALPLAALAFAQLPADAAKPASQVARKTIADQKFENLAGQFIVDAMRLSPVEATALGEHKYDSQLPAITRRGRADRAATWGAIDAALSLINPASLSRDNQVDYAMLRNELQYRVWANDKLQEWAWNPQIYNDIAAGSLYTLAARDFAPWDVRLKSATARMEALPA